MKVSMKKIIRAMSIIMVVIVYITTIILSSSVLDTSNIFNKNKVGKGFALDYLLDKKYVWINN